MKQEHLAVQVRCSASMAGLDGAFVNEERSAAVWYIYHARAFVCPKYAYLWPVSTATTAAVSEREVKLVLPNPHTHTSGTCGSADIIRVRFRALLSCPALASLNLAVPRWLCKVLSFRQTTKPPTGRTYAELTLNSLECPRHPAYSAAVASCAPLKRQRYGPFL